MAQTTSSKSSQVDGAKNASLQAQPKLGQHGRVIQEYDTVRTLPIGLSEAVRLRNAQRLNQILVDTITLYQLYKKHHWQMVGPTFYQLHLLFDKHAEEQEQLIDLLAERVQILGGVAIGTPHDVAEMTRLERAPKGVEPVPVMIDRMLTAHELILKEVRTAAKEADDDGDYGTNDVLVSEVLRTNELQTWFLAEHVVDAPLVEVRG